MNDFSRCFESIYLQCILSNIEVLINHKNTAKLNREVCLIIFMRWVTVSEKSPESYIFKVLTGQVIVKLSFLSNRATHLALLLQVQACIIGFYDIVTIVPKPYLMAPQTFKVLRINPDVSRRKQA